MTNRMPEQAPQDFIEIQQKHEADLLRKQNVVGVAYGQKMTDSVDTGEPALLVLVQQKLPPDQLARADMVPKKIEDHVTDVVQVGEFFAGQVLEGTVAQYAPLNGEPRMTVEVPVQRDVSRARRLDTTVPLELRQRVRPVMGGYSVGHYAVTAGTIATCCYDAMPFPGIPRQYYILSNNHVLANSNASRIGDPILQPGAFDGGQLPLDMIGRLTRYIPIQFSSPGLAPLNYVDAAIAEVPFHLANREVYWIGYVRGILDSPAVGMILQKTGRTTNYSTGRITALNATVDVNYGNGRVARFARQIITTGMSAGGDSGSLVLDLDERAVGLLFAGSATTTVINPIGFVQSLLNIRITEH